MAYSGVGFIATSFRNC